MAAKNIKNKRATRNKKAAANVQKPTVVESWNAFLGKHESKFFWLSFALSVIFGFLLFDVKVSLSGDDSAYILRASKFISSGEFPTYQGSLYPILLSLPMAIFGLNLFALKMFSFLLILAHLYLFRIAFRNQVAPVILVPVLLIIGINSYLLFFASQTFTEPLFLCLQAALAYFVLQYFGDKKPGEVVEEPFGKTFQKYLVIGFVIFLMTITKNLGLVALVAVIAYFLFTRQWKGIGLVPAAWAVFFLPFQLIKRFVFQVNETQISSQGSGLLYKDFYNPDKGYEDLVGYICRFIYNSDIYISKWMYIILGLRPEGILMEDPDPFAWSLGEALGQIDGFTIFSYVVFGIALYWAFKKSRAMLFAGTYGGLMTAATFIVLQTRWQQDRMILIYIPILLLFLAFGLYQLFQQRLKWATSVVPILLGFLLITGFIRTNKRVQEHQPIFKANLKGDMFYGVTPDWKNFFQMSNWAANNLPEDKLVVSRKATLSFIYGEGREFFGIYRLPTEDPAELLKHLQDNGVTHLLVDGLASYSTMRQVYVILNKEYPGKLKLVHHIGPRDDNYTSYIVEIQE